jgi:hypothetical protein
METFRLVVSVPDITWGHVAQMCERAVNPMYKGLYSILEKDMEDVAHLLAALELNNGTEPVPSLPFIPNTCLSSLGVRLKTLSPCHRGMCLTMTRALAELSR